MSDLRRRCRELGIDPDDLAEQFDQVQRERDMPLADRFALTCAALAISGHGDVTFGEIAKRLDADVVEVAAAGAHLIEQAELYGDLPVKP